MTDFKKGFSLIIPIVIVAAIILGGGYFLIKNNHVSSPTPSDVQPYTFKTVKKDIGEMLPEIYVEVYKNGEFLKSVLVGKGSDANNFVVSPDNSHVAFGLGYYSGSCVAGDTLTILNLNSLSLGNAVLIKPVRRSLIGNSGIQFIENIKWLSGNEIEAVLKFGDESNNCGVMATSTATYTVSN